MKVLIATVLALTPAAMGTAPAAAAPGSSAAPAALLAPGAPAAAGPVTVARYTFDGGAPAGRIAENSGRGRPLIVRTTDRGTVRITTTASGRYPTFPARCAKGAATCPRALLEAPDDTDLDPGTRPFGWGATVKVVRSQVAGSANVVQKGVVTTESQWKLQIGANLGKAQCVVVGRGSVRTWIARSTTAVTDGRWHRIGCRRTATALTVAVDGVVRGRIKVPAALTIGNDKPLRIGGPNFNTSSDMFHGSLDDVYATLG